MAENNIDSVTALKLRMLKERMRSGGGGGSPTGGGLSSEYGSMSGLGTQGHGAVSPSPLGGGRTGGQPRSPSPLPASYVPPRGYTSAHAYSSDPYAAAAGATQPPAAYAYSSGSQSAPAYPHGAPAYLNPYAGYGAYNPAAYLNPHVALPSIYAPPATGPAVGVGDIAQKQRLHRKVKALQERKAQDQTRYMVEKMNELVEAYAKEEEEEAKKEAERARLEKERAEKEKVKEESELDVLVKQNLMMQQMMMTNFMQAQAHQQESHQAQLQSVLNLVSAQQAASFNAPAVVPTNNNADTMAMLAAMQLQMQQAQQANDARLLAMTTVKEKEHPPYVHPHGFPYYHPPPPHVGPSLVPGPVADPSGGGHVTGLGGGPGGLAPLGAGQSNLGQGGAPSGVARLADKREPTLSTPDGHLVQHTHARVIKPPVGRSQGRDPRLDNDEPLKVADVKGIERFRDWMDRPRGEQTPHEDALRATQRILFIAWFCSNFKAYAAQKKQHRHNKSEEIKQLLIAEMDVMRMWMVGSVAPSLQAIGVIDMSLLLKTESIKNGERVKPTTKLAILVELMHGMVGCLASAECLSHMQGETKRLIYSLLQEQALFPSGYLLPVEQDYLVFDSLGRGVDMYPSRKRLIFLNLVIGRVLIGEVLLKPEFFISVAPSDDKPSGSRDGSSSVNGEQPKLPQHVRDNLKVVASLMYRVLRGACGDRGDPPVDPEPSIVRNLLSEYELSSYVSALAADITVWENSLRTWTGSVLASVKAHEKNWRHEAKAYKRQSAGGAPLPPNGSSSLGGGEAGGSNTRVIVNVPGRPSPSRLGDNPATQRAATAMSARNGGSYVTTPGGTMRPDVGASSVGASMATDPRNTFTRGSHSRSGEAGPSGATRTAAGAASNRATPLPRNNLLGPPAEKPSAGGARLPTARGAGGVGTASGSNGVGPPPSQGGTRVNTAAVNAFAQQAPPPK